MSNTVILPQLNLFCSSSRGRSPATKDTYQLSISNKIKNNNLIKSKRQRINSLYQPIIQEIQLPVIGYHGGINQLDIVSGHRNYNYQYLPAPSRYLQYAQQYLLGNYISPLMQTGRFMNQRQRIYSKNSEKQKIFIQDYRKNKLLKYQKEREKQKSISNNIQSQQQQSISIHPNNHQQIIYIHPPSNPNTYPSNYHHDKKQSINSSFMANQATQTLQNSQIQTTNRHQVQTQTIMISGSQQFNKKMNKFHQNFDNHKIYYDSTFNIDVNDLQKTKKEYLKIQQNKILKINQIIAKNAIH